MAQTVYPALRYRDARAAIEFLKRSCGFEELAVTEGEDGTDRPRGARTSGAGLIMLSTLPDGGTPFPGGPSTLLRGAARPGRPP